MKNSILLSLKKVWISEDSTLAFQDCENGTKLLATNALGYLLSNSRIRGSILMNFPAKTRTTIIPINAFIRSGTVTRLIFMGIKRVMLALDRSRLILPVDLRGSTFFLHLLLELLVAFHIRAGGH